MRLYSTAKEDTNKVWLLNELARNYLLYNVDSCNLMLRRAIALSEKIGFAKGQVASLHRLSSGMNVTGKKEEGLKLLQEALQIAKTNDVNEWLGRCYIRIADIHLQGMQTDSALYYFTLAEQANNASGNEYFNWQVFMQKALLFDHEKQFDKAEEYFQQSLKLASKRKVRMDYGLLLFQMTSWYWRTGQWEKYSSTSETYLNFLAEGNKNKPLDAAHGIIYFFDEEATPESKIPLLKDLVKQHEHLGNKLSLANTLDVLGDYAAQSGDSNTAITSHSQASQLYAEMGQLELAIAALKRISEIYEDRQDYANAFAYFKKYQFLTDSLDNVAAQRNMQELEVRYETSKMEAEIEQQQEKITLARRNMLIVALAVLLLGAAVAFFLREKRRRAELNLKLQAAEANRLRELDSVKSAFFANISHEFRTPLTMLLGPLREMEEGSFKGDARKYFGIMRRNASRLLDLVNQLLDLSRLESGKLTLNAQPGDLAHHLRAIAGSFQSLAHQRQIDFKVAIPNLPIWVKFDADKLEKIVGNLLSNAFKFTPEEGSVELKIGMRDEGLGMNQHPSSSLVPHSSSLVISISDTGIGIPANHLSHIFERFYQVENTGSDLQLGSGIGLALTKELVELHGGKVEVNSIENQGTTFALTFDFEKTEWVEGHSASSTVRQGAGLVPIPREGSQFDSPSVQQPADSSQLQGLQSAIPNPQSAITTTAHLPIILIAEDHPDVRSYVAERLAGHYQLLEAANGQEALDLALAQTPDLILTDLMMPVMDGVELTKKLKADLRTNHIPVVMLTAKGERTDRIGGIETGAEAYLTKPFDAEELRATLANLLAQRRILQEKFAKQIRLETPAEAIVSLDDKFLQQVLNAIEENLDDETFGVEQLASTVAMSRSNLFRKIEALLGKSPVQLIRERRLLKAKHLLESGAGNSTEVAYMTGFQSLSYFAKCYQEMFGEAPGQVARRKTAS